ncbi:hypothetical protein FIBSPDRAFT_414110 [Athelia psychrophila]|uniref:Uncharacterized protein n=1 Tax=Athelia psychrophila TaxID=1759441 RepID=A0A167UVD2_9AGAM|nr:hypothetical protein FIBSPDRAFT_414110 [Fibularhizoctonia sp. CBS 109695]
MAGARRLHAGVMRYKLLGVLHHHGLSTPGGQYTTHSTYFAQTATPTAAPSPIRRYNKGCARRPPLCPTKHMSRTSLSSIRAHPSRGVTEVEGISVQISRPRGRLAPPRPRAVESYAQIRRRRVCECATLLLPLHTAISQVLRPRSSRPDDSTTLDIGDEDDAARSHAMMVEQDADTDSGSEFEAGALKTSSLPTTRKPRRAVSKTMPTPKH